jgi:hypothetical protein
MFLRDAFRFWFRPMFGFSIWGAVISAGASLAGGLMGRSAKKKANRFAQKQYNDSINWRNFLRDRGVAGLKEAQMYLPKFNTYRDVAQSGVDNMQDAFYQGLDFVKDQYSGQVMQDRLADQATTNRAIFDRGRAQAEALDDSFDMSRRDLAMRNARLGFGAAPSTADLNRLYLLQAQNRGQANLAFADAALEATRANQAIRESQRDWMLANPTLAAELADKQARFEMFPEQFAFAQDMANRKMAAQLAASNMGAQYSLASGAPISSQKLDASNPMGEAIVGGTKMALQYNLDQQANKNMADYIEKMT